MQPSSGHIMNMQQAESCHAQVRGRSLHTGATQAMRDRDLVLEALRKNVTLNKCVR